MNIPILFVLIIMIMPYIRTTTAYEYDVIVIGAGPTGLVAAQQAAGYGKRVALIEEDHTMTRSRISQGDIPLKALIKASQIAHNVANCDLFGLSAHVSFAQSNVLTYIQQVIQKSEAMHFQQLHDLHDITIIQGHALFTSDHTIEVQGTSYRAHRFIIATGGYPYIPAIEGINDVPYYTKDTFFTLEQLPSSVIIIGQGPLGVEFAAALHHLGVKVTLLVKHGLVLPHYDFELVSKQYAFFKEAGIQLVCGANVLQAINDDNQQVKVAYQRQNGQLEECVAQVLLVTLDMIGNTKNMGLEAIGVKVDHDGIVVDATMKSSVDSIYACGDVVGRMYTLSRVAYYQACIAAYNSCRDYYTRPVQADYHNVSSFIQGVTPIGAIGLSEQEARKKFGSQLTIYHYDYAQSARAIIDNAQRGFIKCICTNDGTLIGVHVAGEGADTIIDNVHIGTNFADQFEQYLRELRTSPNYLDMLWYLSLSSAKDHRQGIIKRYITYLSKKIRHLLGL